MTATPSKQKINVCTTSGKACFSSTSQFINAFNVVYVLRPEIKEVLMEQEWFDYIPDVHNVSKFVTAKTSDYIWLGLAGISIFFDVLILAGTTQEKTEVSKNPTHRRFGCGEGASSCPPFHAARDNATGAAAADNATTPPFSSESSRRVFAVDDDDEPGPYDVLFLPPTVRQFFHFSYVFCRATCKFETLGAFASYSRRMIRREYVF
ncbi:hypothetical protein V5799_002601 [Amblyomma americanum]|uniref:Uncharacterized protein n=1 Tax=Amblyomma americanum TaxID=6943 RepID=A0AAQ4DBC7_AMBAM